MAGDENSSAGQTPASGSAEQHNPPPEATPPAPAKLCRSLDECRVDVTVYKSSPWKIAVAERLNRVLEDVRRAVAAAGWTIAADGTIVSAADGGTTAQMREAAAVVDGIACSVANGKAVLESPAPRIGNFTNWLNGWLTQNGLMSAYRCLHSAEAAAILLLNTDGLVAAMPGISQKVSAFLPQDDANSVALDALLATIGLPGLMRSNSAQHTAAVVAPGPAAGGVQPKAEQQPGQADVLGKDQETAAGILKAACDSEDRQQQAVQDFRGTLYGLFLGSVLLAILVVIAGVLWPHSLSLCVPLAGSKANALICPAGGAKASPGDVPLIALMGVLGAAISAGQVLASPKPAGVPYSPSVAQGLVKTALGPLIAVLGIIVASSLLTGHPGILGSRTALLTAGVVFGYSQQVLTRLIDSKATSLLQAASPATPAG
jgi:hypothetical protein